MKKALTVFTPTYNRGYIIEKLYKSLLAQTSDDFCWLIVDDGSTDDTRKIVERLQSEGKFDIEYAYQQNGGKQRAHDYAVELCKTELLICVDSDDTLTSDAVASILQLWAMKCSDNHCAGIVALRGRDCDTPLGTWFPEKVKSSTLWDLYHVHHHRGDTALMYRTDLLREHPYAVTPGEKFIAESFVYYQIDQTHELALLNKVICLCSYLPDGYTANVRRITRDNPVGYMRHKFECIGYSTSFKDKLENTALYLVGAYFGHCFGKAFAALPDKIIGAIATPAVVVLCHTVFRDKR